MFRTITARYAGTCQRCQQPITPGAKIRYGGPRRTYHLKADCPAETPAPAPLPAGWTPIDTTPDDGRDNGAPFVDDRDSADRAPDPEPIATTTTPTAYEMNF